MCTVYKSVLLKASVMQKVPYWQSSFEKLHQDYIWIKVPRKAKKPWCLYCDFFLTLLLSLYVPG